jgi:hypothetical protein
MLPISWHHDVWGNWELWGPGECHKSLFVRSAWALAQEGSRNLPSSNMEADLPLWGVTWSLWDYLRLWTGFLIPPSWLHFPLYHSATWAALSSTCCPSSLHLSWSIGNHSVYLSSIATACWITSVSITLSALSWATQTGLLEDPSWPSHTKHPDQTHCFSYILVKKKKKSLPPLHSLTCVRTSSLNLRPVLKLLHPMDHQLGGKSS